jgi:hypothetical protein
VETCANPTVFIIPAHLGPVANKVEMCRIELYPWICAGFRGNLRISALLPTRLRCAGFLDFLRIFPCSSAVGAEILRISPGKLCR